MSELFASGRVVDLILIGVAVEALVLAAYRLRTGRGPAALGLGTTFAAGCGVLLALRAALIDAPWPAIAAALGFALAAHLVDLRLRWTPAASRPAARPVGGSTPPGTSHGAIELGKL